jgi:predicted AAA+ superfamily ATPase
VLDRLIQHRVVERLRRYPAVALVGPRQCGKTTLARATGGRYFDLEQSSERLRLDLTWDEAMRADELLVLDEAQSWPEVFVRLRGAIDADRKRNGRFLLLGSVAPALMTQVSESLAGRLSVLELSPFLWGELEADARGRLWLMGGYPDGGVLGSDRYPRWQLDYASLLTQRDLPNWGLPARPPTTDRLLRMLAAVQGQTWNASQIAASLGHDYKTVNAYVDYLIGAFLIRRLPSFQANLTKRLVKAPKLYLRDSGLLHALLNVGDEVQLLNLPWVGASWEGFVIEQILSTLSAGGATAEPYHFRTSDGHEIDLLLDWGSERWAIEVKLTASPSPADLARLERTADLAGAQRRFLVTRTSQVVQGSRAVSCDLNHFLTTACAR